MGFADPGDAAWPSRSRATAAAWFMRRRWVRPHAERFHASLTDGGDPPPAERSIVSFVDNIVTQ